MSASPIVVAATITKLPDCRGAVLVTGSHGGALCGHLAIAAGVRAAIFHDAGLGLDRAGIAALDLLGRFGIAAAAVGHYSCRIGDADDVMTRGRISHANPAAARLGVAAGQPTAEAAEILGGAELRAASTPGLVEARVVLDRPARPLVLIDSASLVDAAADRGAVIVTGSHGGLVGGKPEMALRADGFAAVFNDAGIGIDDAGIGRLKPLDRRGIAAFVVRADSARIGEARSTYDGIISVVNDTAARLGATPGGKAAAVLERWASGT